MEFELAGALAASAEVVRVNGSDGSDVVVNRIVS